MDYTKITSKITSDINDAIMRLYPDTNIPDVTVTVPTQLDKADFVCDVAFRLSKILHAAPYVIGESIAKEVNITQSQDGDYTLEAARPGFINVHLTDASLSKILIHINDTNQNYGRNNILAGQRWVIEHTSPNPNKAMHIGHLRNNLIGMAVANIAAYCGASVVRDCIDNNRGIAIARAMWGFLKCKKRDSAKDATLVDWVNNPSAWITPEEEGTKPDHFIGTCYMYGAEAAKKSPEIDQEIRQIALDWENGDANTWKLWKLAIGYAHDGINQTLARIGSHWDLVWHEHEHYKDGRGMILDNISKGIFKRLENGAILSNLKSYNLPDTIVLKSDGTSLYITQDIALTKLKKNRFKADKLFWVIGPEQSLAMKQVFAICEQLGIGKLSDFTHLPYGLISIVDKQTGAKKKMSSRDGNTLYIDNLLDEVRDSLLNSGRDYDEKTADLIAIDAVKFAVLKPSRNSDSVLDIQESINLKGDSGIYILYTLSRINSLLSKYTGDLSLLQNEEFVLSAEERKVVMLMTYFPKKISDALEAYAPNILIEYILDIAHVFNSIYAKEQFISEDVVNTRKKLYLSKSIAIVITNALKLLGIKPVDRI